MDNRQIADVFKSIAGLLEMRGDSPFTIRAYSRAAQVIKDLPEELERMLKNGEDLREIPGFGKAISDKVGEMVDTGGLRYYDRLRADFPEGIPEVLRIPNLGPKTALRAWRELGVTSVDDLERAIRDGSFTALPRMGQKTADNILQGIGAHREQAGDVSR